MSQFNPEETFEKTARRVMSTIQRQFPIEGKKRRLELVGIAVDSKGSDLADTFHVDNLDSQLRTKARAGTWAVPIKATLRLVDKSTGRATDQKDLVIARLPKLTRRYSYIIDGHERQHDGVFRSKPRPYHRIANNGEINADWRNLARGKGFMLRFEPEKGRLIMKIGNNNVSLYSVLRAMGAGDARMQSAWGQAVFEATKKHSKYEQDLAKAYKGFSLKKPGDKSAPTVASMEAALKDYFANQTEVWPDGMQSAFGKESSTVDMDNLLASSRRLVQIQKGRTKDDPKPHELPDDRQSLSEKYLATTEDFIVEALDKNSPGVTRKILARIDRPEVSIDDLISSGMYTKVIKGTFDYAQRPDQSNPLGFVSGFARTTIRGSAFGGVGGSSTNLDEDKLINPTHIGFLDPLQTPESEDTGIVLHLPMGVELERSSEEKTKSKLSTGQELRIRAYDKKKGTWVKVSPADLEFENVAYPDQVVWKNGKPQPVAPNVVCYDKNKRITKKPWSSVRYILPSAKALFSFSANLIPFIQNDSGNRAMMAAKQQEQAVSLAEAEAPLVQVQTDRSGTTFEDVVGHLGSHKAPVSGTVTKVEEGAIHIKGSTKTHKVHIYNNFPLNGGKGSLHATPTVKVGQKVAKGDLIADTNFTKDGKLALGANLRVAFIPWKGLNFEDGIVVSESAAKRMRSSHLHQPSLTIYPGMRGGKKGDRELWVNYATPEKSATERMEKLDDTGVIREGVAVESGDILIAALSPRPESKEADQMRNIGRSLVKEYRDSALTWDHDYPGKVVRVIRSPGLQKYTITVHIRTEEALTVGDKLTGRHGNKGIVSRVVPDHDMPRDKDGNPVHVLLNPAGVPSRMNVGQVLETAASKIAKKTGKPYVIENFVPGVDYTAKVQSDLKKHGLSDTEELFDSETGRSVGQVMVGDQYLLKLHHMVEKKETARSYGSYTGTGDAPSGAGIPGGGQKMDMLATYGMLAHNAKHNLREAYTFKSDGEQDTVWAAVTEGRPLPAPKTTTGMKNFLDYLKGMGINPEKRGDDYVLMPLTDDQIKKMSNGAILLPDKALYAKGRITKEETKGLFDPKITGGMEGKNWSHINLPRRMPNPVFEGPIKVLLGLSTKQYESLVGPKLQADGRSGFDILEEKLSAIDVDKELVKAEEELATASKAKLNKAYKKVRYLRALKKEGLSPIEAYTNKALPVVPPKVRKISIGLDGTQIMDDLNDLYYHVGQAVRAVETADKDLPREDVQEQLAHLYATVEGLRVKGMNLGTRGKERHRTGLMEKLTGKVNGEGAPKHSYFQKGVLSRRQDLSGRSTIVPEPSLGLDEVGVPIQIAMEMYRPFVVKELVRTGVPPLRADRRVNVQDEGAVRALHRAVENRPVLLKRDPALHKFSIMAFKPRIVEGKAVKIHPLVTGGFNADFDGDSMALYVPVSDEAVAEAHKMMPSRNLFSPTNYGIVPVPGQDSLLGIYQASKWGSAKNVPAGTTAARAIQMMKDGKLKPDDVIRVGGRLTTPGRLALDASLPKSMRGNEKLLYDKDFRLNKGGLKSFLTEVARKEPNSFPHTVDEWKNLGNELSFLNGSSFSLQDFHDGKKFKDHVLRKVQAQEEAIRSSAGPSEVKDRRVVELYKKAKDDLERLGQPRYDASNNRVWEWAQAGARGKWEQFSQLVFGPLLVDDAKGKAVPVPITRSYGEGLSLAEYWTSMHGARKGTLDRSNATRDPGALTKDIINTVMNVHIGSEDCGTTEGASISIEHKDATDRYLAKPVRLKDGTEYAAGTLVTPEHKRRITNSGVQQIIVRSPLHCKLERGICAKCFGLNETGKLHSVGTNIGVISGHALGEPVTQLTMRTFHSGGVSGTGGVVDSFKRAKQLFSVPSTLPNKAVLAEVGGAIVSAGKDPRGGFTVVIGTKEHRVVTGRLLPGVKPGAQVRKGDPLSTGTVDPHDLLRTTGSLPKVRAFLTSELDTAYDGMTRRRNIETVVRTMTNLTKIRSAPADTGMIRGQTVPLSEVEAYNKEAKAEGRPLIVHKPSLRPMQSVPLEGHENWLGKLNYQNLKSTYQEGTAQGWAANVHGHPIAGLSHGAEFGLRPIQPQAAILRGRRPKTPPPVSDFMIPGRGRKK